MRTDISGRSMIEMIGVLAIIGVLSIGGIVGYSRAMTRYRINRTIDETTRLVNGIHTMYLTQKNYAGIGQSNGQMNSSIAKNIKNSIGFNPMETDAFGGRWYVADAHPNNDSNGSYSYPQNELSTAFVVGFQGVPEEACMELATINWASIGDGLIGFGIGKQDSARPAVAVKKKDCPKGGMQKWGDNGYWICAQDMPLSPQDAVTDCSTSSNNNYSFSFKYR